LPLTKTAAIFSNLAADNTQADILRPDSVKQFKRLNIAAKIIVRGLFQGLNPSLLKGCSIDFSDLREYSPGDDLRLLDWKAYARTDRFFVKQFEVERDASIYFLLDASPSMSFSSNGISKFEYAKYLLAALAYIGSGQHDRVGLFISPGDSASVLPPHGGHVHLHRLLRFLSAAETNQDTKPFPVFQHHINSIKKRAIIVVVSDLLGEDDEITAFLRRASFGGHSIILFHILDKAERELTFDGNVDFRDLEGSFKQVMHVNENLREKYKIQVAKYCESLRAQCTRLGVEYAAIDTATSFDVALVTYLKRRRRLHIVKNDRGNLKWRRYS
jgi:uncharacterized protein (DUF58 family)